MAFTRPAARTGTQFIAGETDGDHGDGLVGLTLRESTIAQMLVPSSILGPLSAWRRGPFLIPYPSPSQVFPFSVAAVVPAHAESTARPT